jgi:23S rRNA (pseudouridine1915-N3)-methyltransferase
VNITVLTIGKLPEMFIKDAVSEYEKRISAFGKITFENIPAERLPEKPMRPEIMRALEKEGSLILERLSKLDRAMKRQSIKTVAMCIEGGSFSSEAFANEFLNPHSDVIFIIGSSHGLSERVKQYVNYRITMSEMTFSHGIATVMLLEQIYRGYSILNKRRFHK